MRYFKWTVNGAPIYGSGEYAPPGEWNRWDGPLEMCKSGYHWCLPHQVPYWCGTVLLEIEVDETSMLVEDKKCCGRAWREMRRWAFDVVKYAKWCADRAAARKPMAASYAAVAASYAADTADAAARAAHVADDAGDAAPGYAARTAEAARQAAAAVYDAPSCVAEKTEREAQLNYIREHTWGEEPCKAQAPRSEA